MMKFKSMKPAALFACAMAALAPLGAQASAVVYDNGSYVGASEAFNITSTSVADDFTFATTKSFDSVRAYAMDTSPGLLPNFGGMLSWFIYANAAGSPGSVIAQGTVSGAQLTVTNTGALVSGKADWEIAQFDFAIPTQTLVAGTYWFRIKEGAATAASDNSVVYWVTTAATTLIGSATKGDTDEVNPTAWNVNLHKDLAFQLTDSGTVPTPGSLALVMLGGALLAAQRKRR